MDNTTTNELMNYELLLKTLPEPPENPQWLEPPEWSEEFECYAHDLDDQENYHNNDCMY